MQSGVFIIPADQLDAGNAFGEAQGWGEKSLSVPLSATGQEPATHWGARADVGESFFTLLDNPPPEALPILQAMFMDFREQGDAYGQWCEVIEARGLKVIQSGE